MNPINTIDTVRNSAWLYRAMLLGYGLFFMGFFVTPSNLENYHQGFYYHGLALVGLLLLPRGFQLLYNNPIFWLLGIYLLYMSVSGLWTPELFLEPEAHRYTTKYLQRALFIILFFLISSALRDHDDQGFDRMLIGVCFVAAISSLVTLLLWYSKHPFPGSRVWGFSLVRWTIFSAYSFGVFAVLSAYYMVRSRSRPLTIALGIAFLMLFTYVWLSQSRMALGATLLAVAIVSMGSARLRDRMLVFLLVALGVGITSMLLIPDATDMVMSRGWSFRPQIWATYLERAINNAPFFGEGFLTDRTNYVYAPPYRGVVPDAHSGYMGTLRDGGALGLGLLLSAFAFALWRSVRSASRTGNYLSLALTVAVMGFIATDTDRLITRTGGQWLFLWLPLILVMSDPAARRKNPVPTTVARSAEF